MAEALAKELRKTAEAGKVSSGEEVLRKAKRELTEFEALPPNTEVTRTSKKQRQLARDIYESAVVLSVAANDKAAIARHLQLLRPFNFEYRDEIGDSSRRAEMIGLELLVLLVQQELAEFHSLLELVSMKERNDKCITFVTELEQYLSEGSYNKVLGARKRTPCKTYSSLLESLEETVREEIGSCIEVSYSSISISAAQKLMNLSSQKALEDYMTSKDNWEVNGSTITFKGEPVKDLADQIPSHALIQSSLNYAHELERIV
ncbi:26S proteasome non-ATPase regulatory subunit 8 [Hondaea fermentalgiana]|uniref:26S proteasome non-ATPase regulatory subunit 8 n=1 Tax=Hondaea fermentalgiana TaxID=2315210 RepID=A0A2R5GY30_9STRA|nr:26S proteasome non-ATPase regulatory subunit 8 [Hondaea fermentalgiana]|eukprot:GBG34708.1 26S proteasome non-ATPase regulatory subunit 8 [Hondaea fermentalgiana]